MLKVINVAGARPNFMKIAPIVAAMKRRASEFQALVVHTGQHYDDAMSEAFFRDLDLPRPDVYLNVGSGTHAGQTAAVMQAFEPVIVREKPDWVVVVGDVNSTLACAIVCAKLNVKLAHVEAGLRSRDRSMPEEINRLLTDQIADLLLTPSRDGDANLGAEGIPEARIRFVGNVMIDSLMTQLGRAQQSSVLTMLKLEEKSYAVLTLHRPSNVDEQAAFGRILDALEEIARRLPIVFPAHPRTRKMIDELGLGARVQSMKNLRVIDPVGYLDFLRLTSCARLVLTDSGGIQEETTVLGIPCITLRENTERPITVEMGTNTIAGTDTSKIIAAANRALNNPLPESNVRIPEFWDGRAADRILDALIEVTLRNPDSSGVATGSDQPT
ncbi:MAG: UDP-N-acetylglucosamine 2-epimerase (non-hydrolyzing) [Acidobacteria bacterium]|nr:MAG: UDP-N-acetylglucosamine 2-epimerase (non-hydrolyzing) [Acidobacteriota bacterium]